MTEVEQQPPPQNGIDLSAAEDDDSSKARPADIEQDMREMERRKRVEAIMGSKLFREELERIVDSARDGGGILQQLSDIMGVPTSTRVGNVFKATNCMLPINDIRGVESMGYAKGEKILRCKLAATFRLLDLYGWTQGLGAQITARLKVDQENFLVNPYGMMYHEITASSLNKVDMQGQVVEQGTTNFGVNKQHFALHSVVHAARPDIRCAIYIGCTPVVAVSSLKVGLLPLTRDACILGEVTTHTYTGTQLDADERDRLVRALGPNSKVLILTNYGALCCGETIEEAFFAASHIVKACETQLQLLPVGVDNLVLIPEESRKVIFAEARRPPEDLEKKFAAAVATVEAANAEAAAGSAEGGGGAAKTAVATTGAPKWRVGGAEFEALMRMLDNAGYRTGYIYRHPLIKSDPPKPKNDVELPPAVSSLGYLLEEEELLRQGIWKKGDFRKGGDRSRWLNSPNVYQKVEVLETGTPDPKKITKWVAEGSPTHSTPVRIEDALQFVPAGTNPKEFKRLQQQIKDNRRADKISAGPQSHILEGVTWDEANRIKDATVSSAGDHVVLMGAASKGIIQRGYQHNAAVYKAPYAKNPFDNVTDDELNEYKRTVERKKKSIHGEYTDTDFSESEPLSSMPISAPQQTKQTTITTAAVSQSEPEDVSAHQVMRIETQQAPIPSQPEVVLSDDIEYAEEEVDEEGEENYANSQKYETIVKNSATNAQHNYYSASNNNNNNNNYSNKNYENENNSNNNDLNLHMPEQQQQIDDQELILQEINQSNKENIYCGSHNIKRNTALIAELKKDALFQRQKYKLQPINHPFVETKECTIRQSQNLNMLRRPPMPLGGSESDKSAGGVGEGGGVGVEKGHIVVVSSGCSPFFGCLGDGATCQQQQQKQPRQQRPNVEPLGFQPIHPIDPRADANETVMQQPQFYYSNANNNNNENQHCNHQHHYHRHHNHPYPHPHCSHPSQSHPHHHRLCQHTVGPSVGIVSLPHFEQAFGHLLGGGRQTTTSTTNASGTASELCAIYYDNYAPPIYERISCDRAQYATSDGNNTRTVSAASNVTAALTDLDEADNPYKKSLSCCTPAVCDSVFESLRKPRATSDDNNLIFNIPFTAEGQTPDMGTTTTTPSTSAVTTPRKTRFDLSQKISKSAKSGAKTTTPAAAHSPYRTLSHFGFNSPQRDPQPDHKHIPCTSEPKKYVPLRKSISYEEIFSSPRYVDLCEYCFEKIVRLKPEIAHQVQAQTQTQMRLRNLCDYNGVAGLGGAAAGGVGGARFQGGLCPGIMYQPCADGNDAYDYVEYASSDTTEETLPPFSSQLEPVLEVVEEVEPDSNEDATKNKGGTLTVQAIARTPSNSSFIEKIMRLNYSEESADWNFAQAPHRVPSCTNLTLELERAIMGESQREQQQHEQAHKSSDQAVDETRHYNTEMESELDSAANMEGAIKAYVNVEEETAASNSAPPPPPRRQISVTEIWEFMQWQDENGDDNVAQGQYEDYNTQYHPCAHNQNGRQGSGAICLYYENACENDPNNNRTEIAKISEITATADDNKPLTQDEQNTANQRSDVSATSPPSSNGSAKQELRRRSLMTREERSRRKLVFQELWEDHISFLDGKEHNALSDTESAIDGQQEEESNAAVAATDTPLALEEDNAIAGSASECGASSLGREQDVTDELNEGNELLVVRTKEGNMSPSVVVPITMQVSAPLQSEIFDSRSIIVKNCSSGTALPENLDKASKSETLMKLQTTEVRRFSLHDLAYVRREHNEPQSEGEKNNDEIENVQETCAIEATEIQNVAEALQGSDLQTSRSESKQPETQASSVKERSEEPSSPKFSPKDATQDCEDPLTKKAQSETSMHTHTKTKPLYNKPKTFNIRDKRLPNFRHEIDRPPTPKPPATTTKVRRLSSHEPQQPPLLEAVLKTQQKRRTLDAAVTASSSESDDNHSARTYDLSASQECMFFREHEMVNTATNVTRGGIDSEANEVFHMTSDRNVREEMMRSVKADVAGEVELTHSTLGPEYSPREHPSPRGHMAELEVADILINKLKAPTITMERAKAGMALPTDNQKTKSYDENAPSGGNISNVARVAQLTAEALKEPPTKVCTAPRLTKRSRKKTTNSALNESVSNEASTSIQAAQKRTTKELKFMYEPKVEEYVLFKQNIPSTPISPTHVLGENDRRDHVEVDHDVSAILDRDLEERQFAELLESDEHEDLTKLSEEFEELLLNVENLQLQAEKQKREHGGAETHEADSELESNVEGLDNDEIAAGSGATTDCHFNPMERKILRKIRENQLSECEEIFDKIEMTIRNKMTSSQLEQMVKEQSLNASKLTATQHSVDESMKSTHSIFTASTPERFLSAHTTLRDTHERSFTQGNVSGISGSEYEMAKADRAAVESMIESYNSTSFVSGRTVDEADADVDESSTLTPHGSRNCSSQSSEITSTAGADGAAAESNANECASTSGAALKLRRSRSLTPSTGGGQQKQRELSPPPAKLNKTTTPPHESVRNSLGVGGAGFSARDLKSKVGPRTISKWPRASTSTPEMKSTKRNFILENIRNAAIPRHVGSGGSGGAAGGGCGGSPSASSASVVKRLQGNAQAIFCKNPFGPLRTSDSCNKMILSSMSNSSLTSLSTTTTSSSRTIVKSCISNTSSSRSSQTTKQLSPRNSSTGVYTFQSKLVRGSPRFWVSLTQPNPKKLQTQKRRRRSQQQHRIIRLEMNDSTGSLQEYEEEFGDKEMDSAAQDKCEVEPQQQLHLDVEKPKEQEESDELTQPEEQEMYEEELETQVEQQEPEESREFEEVEDGHDEKVAVGQTAKYNEEMCTIRVKKEFNENADLVDSMSTQKGDDDNHDHNLNAEQPSIAVDGDGAVGIAGLGGAGGGGVEHELIALGEQIQQLEPHLDKFDQNMRDFNEHVTKCTHHMDDCIAVQEDIVENQRQLREQMAMQQYAEHIMCQVQTYSISETED